MEHFNYKPTGVCSRNIEIELDGNRIEKVAFTGGCSGNTQGIAALIVGMDIDDAIARLSGIRCGLKQTSCPDQLARALLHIKSEREAGYGEKQQGICVWYDIRCVMRKAHDCYGG